MSELTEELVKGLAIKVVQVANEMDAQMGVRMGCHYDACLTAAATLVAEVWAATEAPRWIRQQ